MKPQTLWPNLDYNILFQVEFLRRMMTSCWLTVQFIFLLFIMTAASPPGCKIRITDRGLEMCKRHSFNHELIYYDQVWSGLHVLLSVMATMGMCTCCNLDKVGHFDFGWIITWDQQSSFLALTDILNSVCTNWYNGFVSFVIMTVWFCVFSEVWDSEVCGRRAS